MSRRARSVSVSQQSNSQISARWLAEVAPHLDAIIDIARGTNNRPRHPPRRFKEHRTWYADNVSIHKRGVVRERSMLKQLGGFFDRYDLTEIDRALFDEWRTWRRRSVRASTVNREHEVLSNVLNAAVHAFLESNPLTGVGSLHTEDFEARILSPLDELAILRCAEPAEQAAILCGLDALLRRGSVASLSRSADHGPYLTILNAKCGTYKVLVSTRLRRALDKLSGTSDRYFETFWPQAANNLTRMFERLCIRHVAALAHAEVQHNVRSHLPHRRTREKSRVVSSNSAARTSAR